jgi:tRNA nucleotidyltransferase (CCA-adding enzyme)
VLFPEVNALFGVPQTEKHHPEIDTGIHTLMVIEQAAKLSPNLTIRFAALTHDLGKGITPKTEWPKHIQHEQKGKTLVKQFCQRLRVPNDCLDLALLVCEHHLNCHRAFELKAATIQKIFKSLDLYRRPERLHQFLLACEADARGRKGFENIDYPQHEYLSACFDSAMQISANTIDLGTACGKEIGDLIEKHRIEAISKTKVFYQKNVIQ